MLRIALPAVALICFGVPAALSGPFVARSAIGIEARDSQVTMTAGRYQKHARGPALDLKGNGRTVKDTCPGGDKACIKELVANCDKAGGGLSTQPDGGVDCYVVGIHDQP